METTLNAIRSKSPCAGGWVKLLVTLGKSKADDEPLKFMAILESNGFYDALWCLRAEPKYDRDSRLFAVWCARRLRKAAAQKEMFIKMCNGDAPWQKVVGKCEQCNAEIVAGECTDKKCAGYRVNHECLACGATLEAGWCSEHCEAQDE